jgi:hypothetical protein
LSALPGRFYLAVTRFISLDLEGRCRIHFIYFNQSRDEALGVGDLNRRPGAAASNGMGPSTASRQYPRLNSPGRSLGHPPGRFDDAAPGELATEYGPPVSGCPDQSISLHGMVGQSSGEINPHPKAALMQISRPLDSLVGKHASP